MADGPSLRFTVPGMSDYILRQGDPPRTVTARPSDAARAEARTALRTVIGDGRSRWRSSILVVEDESLIADAVAARLRSEGYDVGSRRDGPRGVALCDQLEPDLVMLDLMLPGLDGLEVCRRIQQDRHVPVLMLTARDDETDLVVGLAVGADDYLTKPFSMRELVARVQAAAAPRRCLDRPAHRPVLIHGSAPSRSTWRPAASAGATRRSTSRRPSSICSCACSIDRAVC